MKWTIKTTKAQKGPMEKLLFQLEMVLFQLGGCSLQPGYQVGKIPWHGLLQPAALCRAPAPLPAACFKVGNDLARSGSVEFQMSQDSFLPWKFSAPH